MPKNRKSNEKKMKSYLLFFKNMVEKLSVPKKSVCMVSGY